MCRAGAEWGSCRSGLLISTAAFYVWNLARSLNKEAVECVSVNGAKCCAIARLNGLKGNSISELPARDKAIS